MYVFEFIFIVLPITSGKWDTQFQFE
jgi:hypothetical protein